MYLEQAKTLEDWQDVSKLLLDVIENLNCQYLTLWSEDQLTLDGLKSQYKDGELYLAKNQETLEGVIFLQEEDPCITRFQTAIKTPHIAAFLFSTKVLFLNLIPQRQFRHWLASSRKQCITNSTCNRW